MNKLIEIYNLPRLNCKELEKLNSAINSKETNSYEKPPPKDKSLGPNGFTRESYYTFKEDLILTLKLFRKI